MPEKQPVLKQLPKAPWHSELWNDVLKMQKTRIEESEKEAKKWRDMEEEIVIYRERERIAKHAELVKQRGLESAAADKLAKANDVIFSAEENAMEDERAMIKAKKKTKAIADTYEEQAKGRRY